MRFLLISAIFILGANASEDPFEPPKGFVPRYPKNMELLRSDNPPPIGGSVDPPPRRYPKLIQLRADDPPIGGSVDPPPRRYPKLIQLRADKPVLTQSYRLFNNKQ